MKRSQQLLGAQGGSIDTLKDSRRQAASVINVSRGITYAEGNTDYAGLAKHWAEEIASGIV